ncbi:MAG: two-component system, OmpR family, heavy metal sensor histidine kinase CusS [Acidobacteriota bacterium]|nr:two-component system, OmpR family, heavy metal sensor histidine kinase CusS [Acidobacteriota bacterium]
MRAAVSPAREPLSDELVSFAAAVAHDLRTPLAALSGEVDVALRRERSADAYRDALTRIAGSVAELVELTGDLSVLGDPGDDDRASTPTARLDAVLAPVRERYASNADVAFAVTPAAAAAAVAGDEALLTRAVTILVQYALAHRRTTAGLVIRAACLEDPAAAFERIDVVVDAATGTFWPHTWRGLGQTPAASDRAAGPSSVPLRLRTADRIVQRSGGSVHAASADGAGGVHIRLRCAEPM